jgi:type IV pilus assembly protein PilQ
MSAMAVALTTLVLTIAGTDPAPPVRALLTRDGTVTGVQVLPALSLTEIVVSFSGVVETRDFTMQGPDRIVLDLVNARLAMGQESLQAAVRRGGVQVVRASQYSPDIVRVVVEVDGPLGYTMIAGEGYVRISMENPWGDFDFAPWSAAPATGSGALLAGLTANASRDAAMAPVDAPEAVPATSVTAGLRLSQQAVPIDVSFQDSAIRDVITTFSDHSGRSLQTILNVMGLAAEEQTSGIIQVVPLEALANRDELEPLVTRAFRVSYASAAELQPAVESLLTDRGRVSVSVSTNNVVVTDVARVLTAVEELLLGLDARTPSISISAKIAFVNRTDLQELGVVYDLKDSRGNQLNQVTHGGIDRNADGLIREDEEVPVGTNVISLGGNSIAALGNANQRVVSPSLQFLTSIILGRHTLVSFLDALQSVQLSDIQAAPQITTLDNQLAEIVVGERTPIRVIDAGAGAGQAQAGTQFPQATVQIEETGIILRVTPHVTAGDLIWMELEAERSGIAVAEADLGVTFDQQRASTRVLVGSGQTAVIGGLTVTERTEVRNGIPLLQDLPLLGRFFRLTRQQTVQRDLIILVTPQIIRD